MLHVVVVILAPLDIWQCWWPAVSASWWPPCTSCSPSCPAWWSWPAPSPPMTLSSHFYRNTPPTPHTSSAGGSSSTTMCSLPDPPSPCRNMWLAARGTVGCLTSAEAGMIRPSTPPWTTSARTATTSTRSLTSTPCAGMSRLYTCCLSVVTLCRRADCFSSASFQHCLQALLLEQDRFVNMAQIIGKRWWLVVTSSDECYTFVSGSWQLMSFNNVLYKGELYLRF